MLPEKTRSLSGINVFQCNLLISLVNVGLSWQDLKLFILLDDHVHDIGLHHPRLIEDSDRELAHRKGILCPEHIPQYSVEFHTILNSFRRSY
jgi:hypothetical protein